MIEKFDNRVKTFVPFAGSKAAITLFCLKAILSNPQNPLENAAVDPDVALMLRVRDDDAVAFELLVDRHQGKIQRFMQGWVNNVQQAEDLAQDVFLRVFKARKTYLPTAKFTTWLYRIANNIASNHIRDNANRREYQLSKGENTSTAGLIIENIAVAPSGFQPSRRSENMERAAVILEALQALGERQRTALMLSKFEGMSYQEIAETMGLSIQAVKSLLSRARVSIKNLLEPYVAQGLTPSTAAHTSTTEENHEE
jgi:RNA polymerase sigma-70 factor, ECF subfamily